MLIGLALMKRGKIEEARKQFEAALVLAPGYVEPLAQLVSLDFRGKKAGRGGQKDGVPIVSGPEIRRASVPIR